MRWVIETLSFTLLDDICLGLQSGALSTSQIPETRADELGPLLELHHAGVLPAPTSRWLSAGMLAPLLVNMAARGKWFSPSQEAQGFVTIPAIKSDQTAETEFEMRAKRAASFAGFSSDEAGKLAAAIGEFRSNILEHSQKEDSGYLAYSSRPGQFEFVVADAGIGVLESLRSHPGYAHLTDAGTALERAVAEGVSRFHDQRDRGFGFRPVFVGLANIARLVRFRSEDHCREVLRAANGSITASTSQKAQLKGFFCSVACEITNNRQRPE